MNSEVGFLLESSTKVRYRLGPFKTVQNLISKNRTMEKYVLVVDRTNI